MRVGTGVRLSYKKHGRPLLFGAIILLGTGTIGYLAYQQFAPVTTPENITKVQDELPPPSTQVVSAEKQVYDVPPSHPKYITITRLGINAKIISVGVTKEGALDAPKTAWEAGWYKHSSTPGSSGAMLIDGHVNDNRNTPGVFGRLKDIAQGDEINIERGDGTTFRYSVIQKEQIPAATVDMSRLLRPVTAGKAGLNLITCGGTYDAKKGTFSDRVLVFAVLL